MRSQKLLKLFAVSLSIIQVFKIPISVGLPCSIQTNVSTTVSPKLCAVSELWSNETSSCQKTYVRGQCRELMTFVPNPDDLSGLYGVCMCDNVSETIPNNRCAYRPKVYLPTQKRCYKLFTQGPCAQGEWLTLLQTQGHVDQVTCQLNPCQRFEPDDTNDENFWFTFGGGCYLTGTQGFCRQNTLRIYIQKNEFSPLCLNHINCFQFQ